MKVLSFKFEVDSYSEFKLVIEAIRVSNAIRFNPLNHLPCFNYFSFYWLVNQLGLIVYKVSDSIDF